MVSYLKNIIVATGIAVLSTIIISLDKNQFYNYNSFQVIASSKLNPKQAIKYTTYLNSLIPISNNIKSLNYSSGDYTFQITKYLKNGVPFLYVEKGNSVEYGDTEKRYYLKDNHLILVTEASHIKGNNPLYSFIRTYLVDNESVRTERRHANNQLALNKTAFKPIPKQNDDFSSDLNKFEDAINQQNKFNLAFEGITESPKAKYIVIGSSEINGFRAPIKVEKDDELIRELTSNSKNFIGKKLHINWKMNHRNEVIYTSGSVKN
jgi:hypothetical protein